MTVPRTLEDEDSVNLAFGVESFDVSHYAPHPPGYPVYIAFGKVSTAAVAWLHPEWPRVRTAAAGLAWLAILSGALGIFAIASLWRGLGMSPGWATLAALMTAAAPLYWFTAARPLTDMPGLAAAVWVQAALLHGWRRRAETGGLPIAWIVGFFTAGLAIGIRFQTLWLTMPLLVWLVIGLARERRWAHLQLLLGLTAAGVMVWLVPLLWLSGGFAEYRAATEGIARLDLAGVRMLATNPSWAVLVNGLEQTFLAPWRISGVPWLVMAATAAGFVRLTAGRFDRTVAILLISAPYLVFHLLFHEVETTRYALPVVVMVAGLTCAGLGAAGARAGGATVVTAAIALVVLVHPVTNEYSRGWPVFKVIGEMRAARQTNGARPILAAHDRAWWVSSRALDWFRGGWDVEAPPLIKRDETLRLVRYWRTGGTEPIWLLSDPHRRDLARFEPTARVHEGTYQLSPRLASLVGGLRTYDVGWWRLSPPAWMLGAGWSVTQELAFEPGDRGTAVAFIRRHAGPSVTLIGARHLDVTTADAEIVVTLDGREIDRWVISAGHRVVRWVHLPEGSLLGEAPYARLLVSTIVGPDRRRVVALDQFDASDGQRAMVAFGGGWTDIRSDPVTGQEGRRAERRSEIEVRHASRPVRLRLRGSVPSEFEVAPVLAVFAGRELLTTMIPNERFEISVLLSPDQLDAANGVVTLAADLRRTLAEQRRAMPPRQLGVSVTAVEIEEAGKPIRR